MLEKLTFLGLRRKYNGAVRIFIVFLGPVLLA